MFKKNSAFTYLYQLTVFLESVLGFKLLAKVSGV